MSLLGRKSDEMLAAYIDNHPNRDRIKSTVLKRLDVMIFNGQYQSALAGSNLIGNKLSTSYRITRVYYADDGVRLDEIIPQLIEDITYSTVVNAYIDVVDDPLHMLRLGLMPHPASNTNIIKIVELLAEGLSWEEIDFWVVDNSLKKLQDVKIWTYYTKEYALQDISSANSYLFIFPYPNALYSSKRPKTDMSIFQLPISITLDYNDSIPVTRYSAGMSRGLYYTESSEQQYCGTFYYMEPESTTRLWYNSSLTSFSKLTAIYELMNRLGYSTEQELEIVGTIFEEYPEAVNYVIGMYNNKLMYTPQEYSDYFLDGTDVSRLGDRRMYVGGMNNTNLYATEDALDQPLCELGILAGVNIIILTDMVGSHQIVTEVLDTRERKVSFSALRYS